MIVRSLQFLTWKWFKRLGFITRATWRMFFKQVNICKIWCNVIVTVTMFHKFLFDFKQFISFYAAIKCHKGTTHISSNCWLIQKKLLFIWNGINNIQQRWTVFNSFLSRHSWLAESFIWSTSMAGFCMAFQTVLKCKYPVTQITQKEARGLSPVWVFVWPFSWVFSANALWQRLY